MTSGTDGPDHPNDIAEDLLAAPTLERLLDAERVAEVDRAREILLRPVEPVRGGKLLGAEHRQRVEQLGADLVLAAIAPRRRQEHRPVAFPF